MALVYGLTRLGRGVARGDLLSGVFLAALTAFLLVGLFDSLFDSPRLTLLFFLWLFLAIAGPWRGNEFPLQRSAQTAAAGS
jgi:hypothetical protein